MLSGVCKYCGCSHTRPCLVRATGLPPEVGEQTEGCQWLDDDETICSGCVGKLTEDELLGLGAAELPLVASLLVPLRLGGIEALYLAAILDVALKHPDLSKHRTAHRFAAMLRQTLGGIFDDPTFFCTAEILRRGALPDPDAEMPEPEPEPRSALILPGA
jgi:hypothetical protein